MTHEQETRSQISDILSAKGYRVAFGSNGVAESFDRAQESPPDVILADLDIPEIDGWQVLEARSQKTPNARVIFLYTPEEKRRGEDPDEAEEVTELRYRELLGMADERLEKPFEKEALLHRVNRLLGLQPK